jgi:hypothetical protein
MSKNVPNRGLTKVEIHCSRGLRGQWVVLPNFVWSGFRLELINAKWLLISPVVSEGNYFVQPEGIRNFSRDFGFESH